MSCIIVFLFTMERQLRPLRKTVNDRLFNLVKRIMSHFGETCSFTYSGYRQQQVVKRRNSWSLLKKKISASIPEAYQWTNLYFDYNTLYVVCWNSWLTITILRWWLHLAPFWSQSSQSDQVVELLYQVPVHKPTWLNRERGSAVSHVIAPSFFTASNGYLKPNSSEK